MDEDEFIKVVERVKRNGKIEGSISKNDFRSLNELQKIDLIKATGRIEDYLTPEKVKEFELIYFHVNILIKATGKIEKYLTPEKVTGLGLMRYDIVDLIKTTGKIEEYLTPEKVIGFGLMTYDIVDLIKATGKIEDYLTPEKVKKLELGSYGITELIKKIEDPKVIQKYLLKGENIDDEYLQLGIVNVIKATGRIEDYLTPEKVKELELSYYEMTKLIKEIEDPNVTKRYLFEGQKIDNKYFNLGMANIIKATGKIEKYLTPEKVREFVLNNFDITNLIKAIEDPNIRQKYLFEGENIDDVFFFQGMANVIKATGKIEEYLNIEKINEFGLTGKEIARLLPNLTETQKDILSQFYNSNTVALIVSCDENKREKMINILERLHNSNSAELQRIKEQIAAEILEADSDNYEKILNEIEFIYLTSNLPTAGKLFLVFQKLHPEFLGEEQHKIKDDSIIDIPSLNALDINNKKKFVFSDLLIAALESNSRDLRDYIEIIEKGNKLYEQVINGELKIDSLYEDDRLQILKKYTDILEVLYKNTTAGKRAETKWKQTGELENDIKEIVRLFESDRINCNLPDRIVRMFAPFSGIRTLKEAKQMVIKAAEEATERGKKLEKKEIPILETGDYVKGIANTEFFPSMLQRGFLAKEYQGGNASSDATPGDMDVEKVLSKKLTLEEKLSDLQMATNYLDGDATGKKLGIILVVFSKDDFIQTRDENGIVDEEAVKQVISEKSKREVFCNNGTAYGIRTGVGSCKIKCIITDIYVDKLGFEIAKNGFYIPIFDENGNVLFTYNMYKEIRSRMQGLSHYGEKDFEIDETAKNKGTTEIAKLIDDSRVDTTIKRKKILETLNEAVEKNGMRLCSERTLDLTPGFIEIIDIGSTGRGTNEPGEGDFDFIVRLDTSLYKSPEKIIQSMRDCLDKIKEPKDTTEVMTSSGKLGFRYKGVKIVGLEESVDIDLTFSVRTDEIEYSTEECINDRLKSIKKVNPENYKMVIANILLAKKYLKMAGVYKKKNAPEPKLGEQDTRGGFGAVGIENWILQNGGSFEKAARDFLEKANESENLEEFQKKYAIWDFGENYMSAELDIFVHDNFVYNMTDEGYERMKEALQEYLEAIKQEKTGANDKELQDSKFFVAVRDILEKKSKLLETQTEEREIHENLVMSYSDSAITYDDLNAGNDFLFESDKDCNKR